MKKFHIDHQNVRKIAGGLCAVSFVPVLLSCFIQTVILLVLGVALIAVSVVVLLRYWRCPHCGTILPLQAGKIQYCPYCGGKL